MIRREHGEQAALAPEWDATRRAIFGEPYIGYLLVGPFDIYQRPNLTLSVLFDLPGTVAAVDLHYGGLRLIADLGPGPISKEALQWAGAENCHHMPIQPRA